MFITIDNKHSFYELFERAVQKGLLYHIFFWMIFFLFLIINRDTSLTLGQVIMQRTLSITFYIAVVYINLYYLFPRYLKTNQLFKYLIFLILLVVIATPLEILIHYLLFSPRGVPVGEIFTLQTHSALFLGIFFVGFSSSIYKIINDWMEHQRERMDLQRQNLTSELKYLKTQINPHFFFNTLNSLYALTLKKSDKAPEIVLKLSEMMRYMLYESNERMIPLSQEINYIQNYLELERLRHGDNFEIDMEIHGNAEHHQIAPLLFIPFLENGFKHGIDHELKSGYIKVDLDIKDSELFLKVVNSVPEKKFDFAPQKDKKSGGIGLTNVRRRLNILYPEKHKLKIENGEDTYAVSLHLKTRKNVTNKLPTS